MRYIALMINALKIKNNSPQWMHLPQTIAHKTLKSFGMILLAGFMTSSLASENETEVSSCKIFYNATYPRSDRTNIRWENSFTYTCDKITQDNNHIELTIPNEDLTAIIQAGKGQDTSAEGTHALESMPKLYYFQKEPLSNECSSQENSPSIDPIQTAYKLQNAQAFNTKRLKHADKFLQIFLEDGREIPQYFQVGRLMLMGDKKVLFSIHCK